MYVYSFVIPVPSSFKKIDGKTEFMFLALWNGSHYFPLSDGSVNY